MTRRIGTRVLAPCLAVLFCGTTVQAQITNGGVAPEPRAGSGLRTEWAIAPDGASTPKGMVLQADTVLPQEVVLPGGTVLPAGTSLPAGTVLPAGTILPDTAPAPVAAPAPVMRETRPIRETAAEPESSGGVPHVSGGIGASGREEMEMVKSRYNLRMLFAEQGSGSYLADIKVRIDDAAGPTLLTATAKGPWFYANLAPGRYRVTVDNAGQVQTREVSVPASGATQQAFYWAPAD